MWHLHNCWLRPSIIVQMNNRKIHFTIPLTLFNRPLTTFLKNPSVLTNLPHL